ncbi:MAG TPA: nucleoside recognition domain-containing protein [Ignavibacteriales bacterium]|nr:nucleoside recognition domain-containing protein [Ignavibacteriales bacterium]HOL82113.1 nucleoside recognition domain-containing protein [Ignavibacteriales bacterium]HOM65081.1 nucleoside recognition domain-containing protein [Ignavibacteriales bacterium]HPD68210.1 nucleoside recognition domain-containing protein [Ignavibacteriales bacterium]HPP34335.1 nucleoside recognition domain-containing protein [Ignavibacteriales bacterium]
MLNYVWLFLLLFGIFIGITTDISDNLKEKYPNYKQITLSKFDKINDEISFALYKNELNYLFGINNKDSLIFKGKVKTAGIKTIAQVKLSSDAPEILKNMAKSSGDIDDIEAYIFTRNDKKILEFEKVNYIKIKETTNAVIKSAETAVEIAIGLIGIMAFWLGLMKIAEASGLIRVIANFVKPVTKFLFPDVPSDHPAIGAIVMNMSANMLGLSNAATPFGLKAMKELNEINPDKTQASNAMCTFLAVNTAGFTLIPATAIAVRAAVGSTNPSIIIGTTMFAAICSTSMGIFSVKLLEKFYTPNFKFINYIKSNLKFIFSFIVALSILIALITSGIFNKFANNGIGQIFKNVIEIISYVAIPLIIFIFISYGVIKKVKVYEVFVEGAKEGFDVAVKIIPYLVGMLTAIAVFRASGSLNVLVNLLQPITSLVGFPAEALPMALMRPLSGSGSIAIMSEIMKTFGPDTSLGILVSTLFGSSETTFYVLAVYFGSINISKTRHALAAGLLADLAGVISATFIVKLLFGI